jgi:cytochrome P450
MQTTSPFFTPEGTANPYPWYREVREQTPFRLGEGGLWALMRFEDVYGALRDHATFSSKSFGAGGGAGGFPLVLINDDPPRHTRFRKLVNKAFTPGRIAALEPWIAGVAAELMNELPAGEADFVQEYTIPLPVKVIARLLGIPGSEHRTFKRWTDAVLAFNSTLPPETRMQSVMEMMQYFGQMAAARRAEPAEDLITALVEAEVDGEAMQEWEVLGFCLLLLIAGNETTTNLLGNMANILSHRPDLWRRLRDDRSMVEPFVEETLRYESPVQCLFRVATKDVTVRGAPVAAGDRVAIFYGAANRDPEEFPNPDDFQPERDLRTHVAFGHGIHYCLGSPLARAEARITLNALLDRYNAIDPGEAPAERQTATPMVFGFRKLPIRLRRT